MGLLPRARRAPEGTSLVWMCRFRYRQARIFVLDFTSPNYFGFWVFSSVCWARDIREYHGEQRSCHSSARAYTGLFDVLARLCGDCGGRETSEPEFRRRQRTRRGGGRTGKRDEDAPRCFSYRHHDGENDHAAACLLLLDGRTVALGECGEGQHSDGLLLLHVNSFLCWKKLGCKERRFLMKVL